VTLHCPVRYWARTAAGTPALKFAQERWSYQELDREVGRWTAVLDSRGVGPGSRVVLLSGNRPEFVFLVHALARLGAAVAPLNARLTRAELDPLAQRLSPALVIAEDRLRDRIASATTVESLAEEAKGRADSQEEIPNGDRQDPKALLAILFTSGTSGAPKGVELTLGNFVASARASAENLGGGADQRWLACLPLHHVGGLAMLLRTAWYGAQLVVLPRFEPDAVNASLDEDAITHLSLVENALAQTLGAMRNRSFPPALRAALIGGGPVSEQVLASARRASMPSLHTYGLTEATSQVATERIDGADGQTSGSPLAGVKVRIADRERLSVPLGEVGEIEVQGPTVMRGYWADLPGTAHAFRDGWLRTYDLGCLDDRGRLKVFARRSDLIVSGGENIYPAEVEKVLAAHPKIAEVAVVSRADSRWGQVPVAAVVSRGELASASDLVGWCRSKLAAFKVPQRYLAFESLPHNASGKIDRLAVRAMVERALQAAKAAEP
jgi:O-succinylbenzoic acid--CoA ligase